MNPVLAQVLKDHTNGTIAEMTIRRTGLINKKEVKTVNYYHDGRLVFTEVHADGKVIMIRPTD